MAADPRQFTEHNEVGGVNVYLEDKRMSELKSATGKTASQISTADEYIPLQDTDGNLVKINPASFQEAVRNVLGSLLANNDKGTTISGIPALSGSGASLDFGSVTPANLASVLGDKNQEGLDNVTVDGAIAALCRKTLGRRGVLTFSGPWQNHDYGYQAIVCSSKYSEKATRICGTIFEWSGGFCVHFEALYKNNTSSWSYKKSADISLSTFTV